MPQKILIVDDDLKTLRLVGLVLDRNGYEVTVAQSGRQALEKVRTETPDMVVLDIMMPDVDGYELTRHLRDNPDTGADDYVTKPIHPDELISRVQALLARTSRSQPAKEAPAPNAVGFLGSKGGVGTTTLAVNAAVALAQGKAKGQRVVLAELRDGMATAACQLGFRNRDGLANVLAQPAASVDADLIEAQLDHHGSGLLVLSGQAGPPGIGRTLTPDHAEGIVQHLGAMADYLLLDLGVGLGEVNQHILPRCRHVVVTIEPNVTSLTLAQKLLDELNQSLHIPRHKISLVSINTNRSAASLTREDIEETLGHTLTGVIPPAPELAFQSSKENKPIAAIDLEGFAAHQYRAIAEDLIEAL